MDNIDFDDDMGERDERSRTQNVNGTKYTVQCFDPYGAWKVMGSNVPNELKGNFTSQWAAFRAIEGYEASRPKPVEKTIVSTDGKGGKVRIPQNSTLE